MCKFVFVKCYKFIVAILFPLFCMGSVSSSQSLEYPKIKSGEVIVFHTGHTLSYDKDHLIPFWVAYELKDFELEGDAVRSGVFLPDPSPELDGCLLAQHRDYTNSGWVRGHMIPAGDLKYSQKAMDESFYTTNVCPMNKNFNEGDWKRLEEKIRVWAKTYHTVYIITGPLTIDNKNGYVGDSKITVPDAFWKAILVKDGELYYSIAFLMYNEPSMKRKLKEYAITVSELESFIGRKLFYALDRKTARDIKAILPLKELGLY